MSTPVREENKVLREKVKELSAKVKELNLSNQTLLAEVEIYRKEAAVPSFSKLALGNDEQQQEQQQPSEKFIASGDGIYPTVPAASLPNLHSISNPLCCALDPTNGTILASGGADGFISLVTWGSALAPNANAAADTVSGACRIQCDAPVICVSVCKSKIVAAGSMDGSVRLVRYEQGAGGGLTARVLESSGEGEDEIRHSKYVKFVVWSESSMILATGSADGTVQFSKVTQVINESSIDDEDECMETEGCKVKIEKLRSLHFNGVVEAGCFLNGGKTFCLFERGTSYLSYFDLNDGFKLTKQSLNGTITGGFDDHVSFTVMHLCASPDERYICAATDSSRNIILEIINPQGGKAGSGTIIRDLYGHKNDGYSQPKVAWSKNGQYIFGTTQEDCSICVWDVASASIRKKLGGAGETNGHEKQIRDIFSSKISDTLVSASFDKSVIVWLNEF